jgi:hypothetical protein
MTNNNPKTIRVKIHYSKTNNKIITSTKTGQKGTLTGAARRKAEHIVKTYGIDDIWHGTYGVIKIKESDIVYA